MAVTLLTKPESTDTLTRFYARARPPGFWQPVAGQLGEDPEVAQREFWRAVRATALASATLFCLLVGAGAWLTQSPQRSPLTHPVTLLGIGVALIPLWMRLALRGPSG